MAHNDYRTHNVSISLSEDEYKTYMNLVESSGLRKTTFGRLALTGSPIVSPLSPEDKKTINQLSKMARDINRLLGAAYKEGLTNHIKWLSKIECDFNNLYDDIRKNADLI